MRDGLQTVVRFTRIVRRLALPVRNLEGARPNNNNRFPGALMDRHG